MIIGQIKNGIVLDHITAGTGMKIYNILQLQNLTCQVAIITNADSAKKGVKDIIKIDTVIDLDFDVLGYIDPGITVNIIKDGKIAKREHLGTPERITNIIKCNNPRCITTVEQELPQVFKLTDKNTRTYRCIYCETKAKNN